MTVIRYFFSLQTVSDNRGSIIRRFVSQLLLVTIEFICRILFCPSRTSFVVAYVSLIIRLENGHQIFVKFSQFVSDGQTRQSHWLEAHARDFEMCKRLQSRTWNRWQTLFIVLRCELLILSYAKLLCCLYSVNILSCVVCNVRLYVLTTQQLMLASWRSFIVAHAFYARKQGPSRSSWLFDYHCTKRIRKKCVFTISLLIALNNNN